MKKIIIISFVGFLVILLIVIVSFVISRNTAEKVMDDFIASPSPLPNSGQEATSSTDPADFEEGVLSAQETIVFNQINEYRVSKGLKKVKTIKFLCQMAQVRAAQAIKDWSHDQFFNEMPEYKGFYIENLARYYDYKKVVPSWIGSETHNKNLLADVTYMCVAENTYRWALEGWEPKR